MSAETMAALLFAVVTGFVVIFQLALALGAPWGSCSTGGAFPGKYPPAMRVAALAQALILGAIGFVVLSAAGLFAALWGENPDWVMWTIGGFLGIGLVLNLITPSAGQRRIWAPTVGITLACVLVVALGT